MGTKKEKGLLSPITVIADKPKKPGGKNAPGNPEKLNRGNPHSKKNELGLTELEQRFVEYYTLSWNKAEAIRNAGYQCINATSYANELLKKPAILAYVEEKRAEFRDSMKDVRDQLTHALMESAFYDASEYIEVIEVEGRNKVKMRVPQFKTVQALEEGAGKLIQSIKIGRDHRVELKLDDKHQARELLAKHIGYLEIDNIQKRSNAVEVYLPDNGRGDVIDSSA